MMAAISYNKFMGPKCGESEATFIGGRVRGEEAWIGGGTGISDLAGWGK